MAKKRDSSVRRLCYGGGLKATIDDINSTQAVTTVLTTAEVNAGAVIVPGIEGKSFVPTWAIFMCDKAASGATGIGLFVKDTSGAKVNYHVVADCTAGTWVGESGATGVSIAGIRQPAAEGEDLIFGKVGSNLATTTKVTVMVKGFYI